MVYIFTTAYNAEKTLHKAVNSILNQTYTDFCYYLFDNGSLDDTSQIIKEYANKDNIFCQDIRLIYSPLKN